MSKTTCISNFDEIAQSGYSFKGASISQNQKPSLLTNLSSVCYSEKIKYLCQQNLQKEAKQAANVDQHCHQVASYYQQTTVL